MSTRKTLRGLYREQGLTDAEIDALPVLDVKEQNCFSAALLKFSVRANSRIQSICFVVMVHPSRRLKPRIRQVSFISLKEYTAL